MIIAGLILTACTQPDEINIPPTAQSSPIIIGESFTLDSEITAEAHEINIWTPPALKAQGDDATLHPILYLIDGGQDQDFQHIAGLSQLATISDRFNAPIVVGIGTSNRYYQLTPLMTDERYLPWNGPAHALEMGGADDFHAMIQKELRPLIETRYPHNNQRIIMGESLAGFFVMREFLRYPESFTHYISISPSLWLDDRRLAKEAKALLVAHKDSVENARELYVAMADEGGTMQNGLDRVLSALDELQLKHLNVTYADRSKTETHSTIYHGEALTALTRLFGKAATDYGPDPWYLREGGHPDDEQEAQ